jgi:hypothetical protein
MQHHHRILAAREQQRRLAAFGHELAQDMDRFGFEPIEVVHAGTVQRRALCANGVKKETHDFLFVVEDDGEAVADCVKETPRR